MMAKRLSRDQAGFSLLEVMIATVILTIVTGLAFAAFLQGNKALSQSVSRTTVDDAASRLASRFVADLRVSGQSKDSNTTLTGFQQDSHGGIPDVADDDSDLDLAPGGTGVAISYRTVTGFSKTTLAATWTTDLITWRWQPAAAGQAGYKAIGGSEIDADGLDNNGNGLVDEGYVTRTVGSGTPEVVARDVLRLSMPDPADPTSWLPPILSSAVVTLLGSGQRNHGFLIERGAAPNEDRITVTLTTAGRLEDRTIYTRQLVEKVLLRN